MAHFTQFRFGVYVAGAVLAAWMPFAHLGAQQAPPLGIAAAPMPAGPFVFDTAEQHKIRVTVVARGIPHPFSLAFLGDGVMLVSERGGRLRVLRNGVLDPNPVAGVPKVHTYRSGGLLDIVPHPNFATNKLIFFTYSKPSTAPGVTDQSAVTLARARWDGKALVEMRDLFSSAMSNSVSGSRIAFGRDGMIYMTTGAPFDQSGQDPNSHLGKVLRLKEDGTAPADNPYAKGGGKPEVYSMGHRDQLGIAIHPGTGAVLTEEHGPNGGDEVNIILPGRNYGWPTSSYGRNYDGSRVSATPLPAGIEQPILLWIPSVAPTGMLFYTGDRFPAWKGNLFVGSSRIGEIPRTGSLQRVVFNDKLEELRRETLLSDLHQRIRDVRQGPDGFVYVITDEDDGAVLRIEPTQ
ncbi:MAG: PQQ-dependent sugar dehydrogenase [Acidobacteriota bacterium]